MGVGLLCVGGPSAAAPYRPAASVATPSSLAAVSCPTLTACIAVGAQGGTTSSALAERRDGQSWKVVPTPATGAADTYLTAVSCSAPTACTAVGYTQPGQGLAYPGTLLAERWNGSTWAIQSIPEPSGKNVGAYASGVSCPSVNRCVAVGFYAINGAGEHTIAENWNGTSWSLQTFPNFERGLALGELRLGRILPRCR